MKNLNFAIITGLFLSIAHLLKEPVGSQWEGWLVVLVSVAVCVLLFRVVEGFGGKPSKTVASGPREHE